MIKIIAENQCNSPKYIKGVGDIAQCEVCSTKVIRYGFSKNGKQRFRCTYCKRSFVASYTKQAHKQSTNTRIKKLTREGTGIRSIARILNISACTVLKRIQSIAEDIPKPIIAFYNE